MADNKILENNGKPIGDTSVDDKPDKPLEESLFNSNQLEVLKWAEKLGVDLGKLKSPEYNYKTMDEALIQILIYDEAFSNKGFDKAGITRVKDFSNKLLCLLTPHMRDRQVIELAKGIYEGVDWTQHPYWICDSIMMRQIRLMDKENMKIEFDNPRSHTPANYRVYRYAALHGLDYYDLKNAISSNYIRYLDIAKALEEDIDVIKYIDDFPFDGIYDFAQLKPYCEDLDVIYKYFDYVERDDLFKYAPFFMKQLRVAFEDGYVIDETSEYTGEEQLIAFYIKNHSHFLEVDEGRTPAGDLPCAPLTSRLIEDELREKGYGSLEIKEIIRTLKLQTGYDFSNVKELSFKEIRRVNDEFEEKAWQEAKGNLSKVKMIYAFDKEVWEENSPYSNKQARILEIADFWGLDKERIQDPSLRWDEMAYLVYGMKFGLVEEGKSFTNLDPLTKRNLLESIREKGKTRDSAELLNTLGFQCKELKEINFIFYENALRFGKNALFFLNGETLGNEIFDACFEGIDLYYFTYPSDKKLDLRGLYFGLAQDLPVEDYIYNGDLSWNELGATRRKLVNERRGGEWKA